MPLKDNINKIHIELLNEYSDVSINEGTDKKTGNFINLIITENKKVLDIKINKRDLEFLQFNWGYKSDPSNENSFLVERNSELSSFLSDVKDVINNNRFDSEYIKNIK